MDNRGEIPIKVLYGFSGIRGCPPANKKRGSLSTGGGSQLHNEG